MQYSVIVMGGTVPLNPTNDSLLGRRIVVNHTILIIVSRLHISSGKVPSFECSPP